MVEKRIVTKNKDGEVIKIIEHHDPNAEQKALDAKWRVGFVEGVIVTALLFGLALARFARF